MANGGNSAVRAPEFRVLLDGTELPPEETATVVEVAVHQDVDAAGMFQLRLVNWDMNALQVTWSDDERMAEGSEVEILMGYAGELASVMVGEITGLEPEFRSDDVPMLTVRGYDRRHRLLRGRRVRAFNQVKDSDIASQIAGDAGLSAKVEDTGVLLDYVLQNNQTDLAFLEARARRLGYEVVVEDKTLHFRAHQNDASETLTLARDGDLLEFYPRLTTVGQVGKVQVLGWSPKDKEAVLGEAAAGSEASQMGGTASGPSAADKAFGKTVSPSVDRPVFSKAEADLVARGHLEEMALAYVSGEGVALGRTDLKAGTVISVEGMGDRFSGLYYVVSVSHSYAPRRGYRTAFTVRRNAT